VILTREIKMNKEVNTFKRTLDL